MTRTADELLASVKTCVTIPSSQSLLTDANILTMADEELASKCLPMLISQRQEYLVYQGDDIPLVANQANYDIPARAAGRTIRELKVKNTGDERTWNLPLIALEDANSWPTQGNPWGFHFSADNIVLVPTPLNASNLSLAIWYEVRPSRLIPLNQAGMVTAVSGAQVTVASSPSTFISGALVDMIKGTSTGWFKKLDRPIVSDVLNVITFASVDDVPATLVAGDYITPAQYSPIIQLPDEMFTYLRDLTAIRVLEAVSDYEGAGVIKERSTALRQELARLFAPRTQGEDTKIIHRNGLLNRGFSRAWGRYSV